MLSKQFKKLYRQLKTLIVNDCTVVINGQKINVNKGQELLIANNKVFINGKEVKEGEDLIYFNLDELLNIEVSIIGNIEDVLCEGNMTVSGNINDASCNGSIIINGDVNGGLQADNYIEIHGNHSGDIDESGYVEIKGNHISGNIDTSDDVTIHGLYHGGNIIADNVEIKQ